MKIQDGTGSGNEVKVDNTNRVCTRSVNDTTFQESLVTGKSFAISSSVVALTTANASGLLYIKNNDNRDMLISKFNVFIGNTTNGTSTSDYTVTSTINPTGGTLISTATEATPVNLNFGSSLIATVDSFSGAEGKTVTGGVGVSDIYADSGRFAIEDVAILPKGFSIAFSVTPKTSNTNVDVIVTVAVQFLEVR